MPIIINSSTDWQLQLVQNNLLTVVDPLVLRCGELFLKGAKAVENKNDAWDLLNRNIHAVGMFFDTLVLQQKIPVFNYGDTFDREFDFKDRPLARINQYEEVMFDVEVGYGEYHRIKDAALIELSKIYNDSEPAKIKRSIAFDILGELSFSGYQWNPWLESPEEKLHDENEKQLAKYLLGGLIFGGYVQEMGTEQLLQPKRSRIFAALAMKALGETRRIEKELFDDLKKYANTAMEEIPWMPTFFPYLLSKVNNSAKLLKEVVALRRSKEVIEYRKWLKELIDDWRINGRIAEKKERTCSGLKKVLNVK